ncbi:MAG: right-handed parallel beta-helix repeat-containing protein [Chloroflexi bacterium]|nr:right-handed parallel beta-helix repeat-containing protein [Chloroflexota bacterium]
MDSSDAAGALGSPVEGEVLGRTTRVAIEASAPPLSLRFEGDFVRVVGTVGPDGGQAQVRVASVDGGHEDLVGVIDTRARRVHAGLVLFGAYELPPGPHLLTVDAPDAGTVLLEAVEHGTAIRGTVHVDSRGGGGDGTSAETPLRDLVALRGCTFAAGAAIRLARGATWDQQLGPLYGSGTAERPIVIGAYGEGPRPHIERQGRPEDRAVWLHDADHWVVRDLEVSRTGAGIVAFYSTLGHHGLTIEDVLTHDNDAVHWHDSRAWAPQPDLPGMYHGAAILVTGQVPLVPGMAVLEGVRVERVESVRDSDPFDISGFDPGAGNLEFLHRDLGTHAVRDITVRSCDMRDAKGAMNFDNVEDLTVLGCSIQRMCRVQQLIGTTSLFLWSVDRVTIRNCTFTDLPDTGSVDGTGIDLEAYTRRVRIEGNLFARNAGSGVEFLAIEVGGRPTRPDDHALDHRIAHNGFWDDVRKDRPDRPSEQHGAIHFRNDTRSPMSGMTEGNLVAEPTGFVDIVAGHEIGDWTFTDDLAVDLAGLACFADVPGLGIGTWDAGVRIESGPGDTDDELAAAAWHPLTERAPMLDRWGTDDAWVERFAILPAEGGIWTGRRWIAPRDGVVAVRGVAVRHDPAGAALRLRIVHDGAVVWPMAGDAVLDRSVPDALTTRVDGLAVRAGDQLCFEVRAIGRRGAGDIVSWNPIIGYLRD